MHMRRLLLLLLVSATLLNLSAAQAQDESWFVSYGGTEGWVRLNSSDIRIDDLRFGDFDGDGTTDVFYADGDGWWVSWLWIWRPHYSISWDAAWESLLPRYVW